MPLAKESDLCFLPSFQTKTGHQRRELALPRWRSMVFMTSNPERAQLPLETSCMRGAWNEETCANSMDVWLAPERSERLSFQSEHTSWICNMNCDSILYYMYAFGNCGTWTGRQVKLTYHHHSIGTHILPVVFNVPRSKSRRVSCERRFEKGSTSASKPMWPFHCS